jgi:hypothetical protein
MDIGALPPQPLGVRADLGQVVEDLARRPVPRYRSPVAAARVARSPL